jgi:site-specific recombinase XerD
MIKSVAIPQKRSGTCLDPYIPSFDARLIEKNFKSGTIRQYRMWIRRLASLMEANSISPGQLTSDMAAQLVRDEARNPRKSTWNQNLARRFVKHLIELGVASPPVPTAKQIARERLRADFEDYLHRQRGLSSRRIYNAWRFADRFLDHRFGAGNIDLAAVAPSDVIKFLHYLLGIETRFRNRAASSLVRLFFQFLFSRRATGSNLALCIPKVAQRRHAGVPRYLSQDQVDAVLKAVRSNPKHRLRGYAMILLMARLGLRAPEVVAIQLNDIDWRAGELLVCGKGARHDRVPIPPDVGEALADYIRHERVSTSRALFVTRHASNGPFKDGQVTNAILKDAFATAGIKPLGRYVGSNVLRHSLATNMVRKGASLAEISDMLRHRSRASTMIYAKMDVDGLRSIARPWPLTGDVR